MWVGATPVFVDIDARTFNIDVAKTAAKVDELLRVGKLRPRALMPVDIEQKLRGVADRGDGAVGVTPP